MRDEMKKLHDSAAGAGGGPRQNTQYYEVERDKKASHLTHEGIAEAQNQADIGSFYVGSNMDFPHLLETPCAPTRCISGH